MKPVSVVLWIVIVGAMTTGLFQLKYAVQSSEDELARLNRELIATEEAVQVLHAEWSYLNRPERLVGLAARYLDLEPMAPKQIGSLNMTAPRVSRESQP
jgi:hypothetical protein